MLGLGDMRNLSNSFKKLCHEFIGLIHTIEGNIVNGLAGLLYGVI